MKSVWEKCRYSVFLLSVYPQTVILENYYEICGGKYSDMLSAVVSLKIALTKISTFFGPYADSKPQWIVRHIFNILFGNYTMNI